MGRRVLWPTDSMTSHPLANVRFTMAALALILVAPFAVGCSSPNDDENNLASGRILPVRAGIARYVDSYEVDRTFVGRVESTRASDLSFELSGTLEEVAVEEGDAVDAGALLAKLDTDRLLARRTEVEAALDEAKARVGLAKTNHRRVQKARDLNAVSARSADEAEQTLAAQSAALRRIEAQLHSIDVELEKSTLRAPFAGRITNQFVDEGTVVAPGRAVVRLLDTEQLEARLGIAPTVSRTLNVGAQYELRINHQLIPCTLKAVLPERNRQTRTISAIFTIENPKLGVTNGDLAELVLKRNIEAEGTWLPLTALTEGRRGLWATYVLAEQVGDGLFTLESRQVDVLFQTTDKVFVRGALRDGERYVVSGLHRIVPDQIVMIAQPDVAPQERP